jgi:hypothetical protein
MPAYSEAPRKEACSFSLNDISTLLHQMSDKEKSYSLRARSSIRMVGGKQETVYLLFLRNGNESVFERLSNWWNAEAQRALAHRLICAALAGPSAQGVIDQMAMRTLVQEKALLRVRKMDRIAPEEIRTIFSECDAAQQEMQVFKNKLLFMASEDRLKFQELAWNFEDVFSQEKTLPTLSLLIDKNSGAKNPINEILAEAESHYLHAMLQALMRFTKALAENRPMSDNDLALVVALIDKRKTMRSASGQTDTIARDDSGSARGGMLGRPSMCCFLLATSCAACRRRRPRRCPAASAQRLCRRRPGRPRASLFPSLAQPHCRRCSTAWSSRSGPAAPYVPPARSMSHRKY